MQGNSRLATAVHALALVMVAEGEASNRPVTSEEMAVNVGAHPVHVRRVLARLRDAGMVTSQSGPHGGWVLAVQPSQITLKDIYLAVDAGGPFDMPENEPQACCRFAPRLPAALETCLQRAELAMVAELARVTLADLLTNAR